MRISDWSSDVCSSDLADKHQDQHDIHVGFPQERQVGRPGQPGATIRLRTRSPPKSRGKCQNRRGIATVSRAPGKAPWARRSEEHTSELQSLMRISYAVFCLKKKKLQPQIAKTTPITQHQAVEK